jgi:hypothetical protein
MIHKCWPTLDTIGHTWTQVLQRELGLSEHVGQGSPKNWNKFRPSYKDAEAMIQMHKSSPGLVGSGEEAFEVQSVFDDCTARKVRCVECNQNWWEVEGQCHQKYPSKFTARPGSTSGTSINLPPALAYLQQQPMRMHQLTHPWASVEILLRVARSSGSHETDPHVLAGVFAEALNEAYADKDSIALWAEQADKNSIAFVTKPFPIHQKPKAEADAPKGALKPQPKPEKRETEKPKNQMKLPPAVASRAKDGLRIRVCLAPMWA